jgi:hypothetical protein
MEFALQIATKVSIIIVLPQSAIALVHHSLTVVSAKQILLHLIAQILLASQHNLVTTARTLANLKNTFN